MAEFEPTLTASPPEPRKLHMPTLLQFALSILAILGLWGLALLAFQTSLIEYFSPISVPGMATTTATAAFSIFVAGVLTLPSAAFAFLRLIGRSEQIPERLGWISKYLLNPNIIIFVFPVIWMIGSQLPISGPVALFLFPIMHVLAVGLPVWWLLNLAKRKLAAGSQQRKWGLFAVGMIFSPLPILFAEAIIGVIFVVIAFILIPGMLSDILTLSDRFVYSSPSLEDLLPFAEEYFTQPAMVILILLFFSLAVPLIEELFKPIGVWFLARRQLTPQQGFAAGAISGAGFGFFETLLGNSNPEGWGAAIIGRVGTAVMHILTSGIVGWGLAQAFTNKRFLRLILSYLGSVGLHGAWNIIPILIGVTSIPAVADLNLPFAEGVVYVGLGILAAFSLVAFVLMLYINRRLARAMESPSIGAQTPDSPKTL